MNIYTDSYLNEFPIFSNIKLLLDQYESVVVQDNKSLEEINSRNLFSKWAELSDSLGSEDWVKKDWDNFLTCMSLAIVNKSLDISIAYAMAGSGIIFNKDDSTQAVVVTTSNNIATITINVTTLKEPILDIIKNLLAECIKSLVLYQNPNITINVDYITIAPDKISIDNYNYLNIFVGSVIDIPEYDRDLSTRRFVGRSIVSMYPNSSDRSTSDVYLKFDYNITPYLSKMDYSMTYTITWNSLNPNSSEHAEIRTSLDEPYVYFNSDNLILWVRNQDLPDKYASILNYGVNINIVITNTYTQAVLTKNINIYWFKSEITDIQWDNYVRTLENASDANGGIGYDIQI